LDSANNFGDLRYQDKPAKGFKAIGCDLCFDIVEVEHLDYGEEIFC